MRLKILTPHKALEVGVRAQAGDVVNVGRRLATVLIRDGAAARTTDAVGPWRDPEPTGYAAMSWEDLQREAKARGIEGRDRMGLTELLAALQAPPRPTGKRWF